MGKQTQTKYRIKVEQFDDFTVGMGNLEHSVEKALEQGWKLQGAPFVAGNFACQAMTKQEPQKKAFAPTPLTKKELDAVISVSNEATKREEG
jgi:hypothetical protein